MKTHQEWKILKVVSLLTVLFFAAEQILWASPAELLGVPSKPGETPIEDVLAQAANLPSNSPFAPENINDFLGNTLKLTKPEDKTDSVVVVKGDSGGGSFTTEKNQEAKAHALPDILHDLRFSFDYALDIFEPEYATAIILEGITEENIETLLDLKFEVGVVVVEGEIVLFSTGNEEELGATSAAQTLLSKATFISHTHIAEDAQKGPSTHDLEQAEEREYVITQMGVYSYDETGHLNQGRPIGYKSYLEALKLAQAIAPKSNPTESRKLLNQFITEMDLYNEATEEERQIFRASQEVLDAINMSLEDGDGYTNTRTIDLNLAGAAGHESELEMRIAFNGTSESNYSAWESFSATKSITIPNWEGTNYVNVEVRDEEGNVRWLFKPIVYDKTVPTASFTIGDDSGYTNNRNVTLNLSASDNLSEPLEMRFAFNSTNESAYSTWEDFSTSKNVTIPNWEGTNYVNVQVRDQAGNVKWIYDSVVYDKTVPTASFTIGDDSGYTNNRNVTLNLSASDNLSEPLEIRYAFNSTNESAYSAWEDFATTKNVTIPNWEGTNYVNVQVRDQAGNVKWIFDSVVYDKTVPTASFTIGDDSGYTDDRNVTLNLTGSDNLSEPLEMRFAFNSTNESAYSNWEDFATTKNVTIPNWEGTNYVNVQVRDQAGNVKWIYDSVILDRIAPEIIVISSNFTNDPENYVLTFTADGIEESLTGNALEAIRIPSGELTEGDNTLRIVRSDLAGNTSTLDFMLSVDSTFVTEFQAINMTKEGVAVQEGNLVRLSDDGKVHTDYLVEASGVYALEVFVEGITIDGELPGLDIFVDGTASDLPVLIFDEAGQSFLFGGIELQPGQHNFGVSIIDSISDSSIKLDKVILRKMGDLVATEPLIVTDFPSITNENPVTISGTKPVNSSVWVNGVEVVPYSEYSTWTALVTLDAEGINNLSFTTRRSFSILGSSPVQISLELDQTRPANPAISPLVITETNQNAQTIFGTKEAGTSIVINGAEVSALDNETNWSAKVSLFSGKNVLTVSTRDAAGNLSFPEVLTLDRSDENEVAELSLNETLSETNQTSITINGKKQQGSSVQVVDIGNGSVVSEFPADMEMQWELTIALGSEGNHDFEVRSVEQNVDGDEVNQTISFSIVRDTIAPVTPTAVPSYTSTQNPTVLFTGAKEANTAIFVNGEEIVPVNSETTWEATLKLTEQGNNNFSVTAIDVAGNMSSVNDVVVERTSGTPAKPTIDPSVVSPVNERLQTLSGTKTAGTAIFINGEQVIPLDNETIWSVDVNLAKDGPNEFWITTVSSLGVPSEALGISLHYDAIAPAGVMNINYGADVTRQATVTLALKAGDLGGSSVSEMSFSTDGVNYSTPEVYATEKEVELPNIDKLNTVYVKFKDEAGNWSAPISSSIIYESEASAAFVMTSSPATTDRNYNLTFDFEGQPQSQNFQLSPGKNYVTVSVTFTDGTTLDKIFIVNYFTNQERALYYDYDALGNISRLIDENGETTQYFYNTRNLVSTVVFPDDSVVKFEYDANGNRTVMEESRGRTEYEYDFLNRLTKVTDPEGKELSYEYDFVGNTTAIVYPDGTRIGYAYDMDDRLTSVTDSAGTTSYEYNLAGDVTRRVLANGVETLYTYDVAGRLTDIVNKQSGGVLLSSTNYELDAKGNRTKIIQNTPLSPGVPLISEFTYDFLDRVISAKDPDGRITNYTYDLSGNRLTETVTIPGQAATTKYYTYNDKNQLYRIGSFQAPSEDDEIYYYDQVGNMVSRSKPGQTTLYTYDTQERLIQVDDGTHITQFLYDADGNRYAKIVDGVRTDYIVDANREVSQVLQEIDSTTGSVKKSYTFGHERLHLDDSTLGDSFYLTDALGSTNELVNSSQSITGFYRFDAFGNPVYLQESQSTDFLFAGENLDRETGFYYLRNRYYDPATGRFISRDPVLADFDSTQSINPYPYVQNNPVNYVDPLGLSPADNFMNFGAKRSCQKCGGFTSTEREKALKEYRLLQSIARDKEHLRELQRREERKRQEDKVFLNRISPLSRSTQLTDPKTDREIKLVERKIYQSERGVTRAREMARRSQSRGGILLNKTAELVDSQIGSITGVVFDPVSGQMVLSGEAGEGAIGDVSFEDLAIALNSVFSTTEDVGVTLNAPYTNNEGVRVKDAILFGETTDTPFGAVLLEADLIFKELYQEQDYETGTPITVNVPGYKSEFQLMLENAGSIPAGALRQIYFVPGKMELTRSEDGKSFVFSEAEMTVVANTWVGGLGAQLVSNPASEQYAAFFTEHFDEIAEQFPILTRMKQLAKAVAIARFIKDNNIPMDLSWLDSYEIPFVDTPDTINAKYANVRGYILEGGVSLSRLNGYLGDDNGEIQAFESTVLDAKASDVATSWQTTDGETTYNHVALSSAPTFQDSNVTLNQEDLSFQTPGDFSLELNRYYDSLDIKETEFGYAWQFLPSRIKFNRPAYVNSNYLDGTTVNGLREGQATFLDYTTGEEVIFQSTLYVAKSGFGGVDEQTDLPVYIPVAESNGSSLQVNQDRTYTLTKADGSVLNFDTNGNILQITNEQGHSMNYEYSNGKVIAIIDFMEREITLTYDSEGRISRADGPLNYGVVYNYNAQGELESVFNEHSLQTWNYEYDTDHRITKAFDADGKSILEAELDVMGRSTMQKDDRGNVTTISRTADNKRVTITDPVTGNEIVEEYDDLHRLIKQIDYLGNQTVYAYLGDETKPFSITNAKGFTTYFTYDQNHNITNIFDFENNVHQVFEYDERNNMISSTDRNGVETTYVYSSDNLLKEIHQPVNETEIAVVKFNYDTNGQVESMVDALGRTRGIERDAFGNVTAVANPEGGSALQNYDGFSRISRTEDAEGRFLTYDYNELDLATAIHDPFGTVNLTYDEVGRILTREDKNGNLTSYTYDPNTGDLLSTIQGLAESRYTYDRFGNQTSIEGPNGMKVEFVYDDLGRLVRKGDEYIASTEIVEVISKPISSTSMTIHIEANRAIQDYILKYREQGQVAYKALRGSGILSHGTHFDIGELKPDTIYEYLVEGIDLNGDHATHAMQTFQTPAFESDTPYVLTNRVEGTDVDSVTVAMNVAANTFVGEVVLRLTPVSGGETITMNKTIIPDVNNAFVITGLEENKEYVYTLFAQNFVGGNYIPQTTKPIYFWTKNSQDTVAPEIISNEIFSVTATGVAFRVTADEPLAKIIINVTSSSGSSEYVFYTPEAGKELFISGLTSQTNYTYTITAFDFSGNEVTTEEESFMTANSESDAPEIISHAPIDIQSDHVKIRVKSNEPLARVIIRLLPANTLIPQEFSFGSSSSLTREFTLTGLTPGVDYFYFITIIDQSGNITQTLDFGEFHTRAF